ncbi:MAG: hypothetical protein JWM10_303, partial [Myxococcaceae bacterium]|nr:hypothetical protein [Myxococcaceae bacterium]
MRSTARWCAAAVVLAAGGAWGQEAPTAQAQGDAPGAAGASIEGLAAALVP